ncbi:MAG: phosphopentomutase [Verrucomicrobiales bacterium]
MRALCIILDSVGCGHAPDAVTFGDSGANTLGHLFARIPDFELPTLASLGLHHVMHSLDPSFRGAKVELRPHSDHCHLTERSAGKDTTTGHWELMGARIEQPFATFERFPPELVGELERLGNCRFIGNEPASGTEIIQRLGAEHCEHGHPILYTSADSVLQIAAHEDPTIFGLERLQALCQSTRDRLDQHGIRIGRVIARPFIGDSPATFQRTANRHDYSLTPPPTVLNHLQERGVRTIGIGKIADIFAHSGIEVSHPTHSNQEGMRTIEQLWAVNDGIPELIFANLVDFDMLYGHRRDPEGYAQCLREFDRWLAAFLPQVGENLLAITADHGNDPYHPGSDHTRERVPLFTLNAPTKLSDGTFPHLADLLRTYFKPQSSGGPSPAAGSTPRKGVAT